MTSVQPQCMVAMTTAPQASVAMPTSNRLQAKDKNFKKVIRGLAIAEIVLGLISILAGATVTGIIANNGRRLYFPLFGEGMWGGIFVVIAGGIGVPAGGAKSNMCLINTHMGFSIFGAVVSAHQFSFAVATSFLHFSEINITFLVLVDVASIASFILLIVSASFCCCSNPGCCRCNEMPQTQVVYITNNPSQAVTMQGVPGTNQGYIVQSYQPTTQVVQQAPIAPSSSPFNPAGGSHHPPPLQNAEAVQTKEEEAMISPQHRTSDPPPYST